MNKLLFGLVILVSSIIVAACAPTSTTVLGTTITQPEHPVIAQATAAPPATDAPSATTEPPATDAMTPTVEAAATVTASEPVSPTEMADLAPYLTLNLKAGFPLDPFIVSVNGGGDIDAATLAPDCTGYISDNPTVTVLYSGKSDLVRLFYYTEHDATLVVKTPDGSYLCNDDTSTLDSSPVIEAKQPAPGTYEIWVGSYDENQLIPGVLVLTAQSNLTPETFSLEDLIDRPTANEPHPLLPILLKAMERKDARTTALATDKPLVIENVTSDGNLPAFDLPIATTICNGFITAVPTTLLNVPAGLPNITLFFEGSDDASLVVVGPDHQVWCNDDFAEDASSNPRIKIPTPAEGTYAIFVGRVDTESTVDGKLTVTTDPDATPVAATMVAPTPAAATPVVPTPVAPSN